MDMAPTLVSLHQEFSGELSAFFLRSAIQPAASDPGSCIEKNQGVDLDAHPTQQPKLLLVDWKAIKYSKFKKKIPPKKVTLTKNNEI